MRFAVDKWYLDLVTPEGLAWIGYAARVRVLGLSFGYFGHLSGGAKPASSVHRFRLRSQLPDLTDDEVRWSPAPLDLEGSWKIDASAARRRLGDSEPQLEWQAHATRAHACVTNRASRRRKGNETTKLAGLGYVEQLTLTGSLELGIDVLHWGRWIADESKPEQGEPQDNGALRAAPRSIVWIRWEGPEPLRIVLVDSKELAATRIDEEVVAGDFGELDLEGRRELRSGGLGKTLFAHLPSIVGRVARRMRSWDETKWVTRTRLARPDGQTRSGWAIHEVVRFARPR